MAEGDRDDPLFWDENRVVQELCTTNRTWQLPSAKKLPDPEILKTALLEYGVDGESLLKNDDLEKRAAHDLLTTLGIKKLPQRLAMQQAIQLFKTKSPQYRSWKQENMEIENCLAPYDDYQTTDEATSRTSLRDTSLPIPMITDTIPPPATGGNPLKSLTPSESEDYLFCRRVSSAAEERPMKKRRLAPVKISNISIETSTPAPSPPQLPTEADVRISVKAQTKPSSRDQKGAYLGPTMLTPSDILRLETLDDLEDLEEQSFSRATPIDIPPGRRLQRHRALKTYLLTRKDTFGSVDRVELDSNDPDDVLPLFGESDEEYDSETLREIDEEEQERKSGPERENSSFLSNVEAEHIIQVSILKMKEDWLANKLAKQDSKAYKLWHDSRRNRTRGTLIARATKYRDDLDSRIAKLVTNLKSMQWSNRMELENQMVSLEVSVHKKEEQSRLISILKNPVEPPKPASLPKPKKVRKRATPRQEGDEEILSSSDENHGLTDFIDDDNDKCTMEINPDRPGSGRSRTATGGDEIDTYDLSQVDDNAYFPPGRGGGTIHNPTAIYSSPAAKNRCRSGSRRSGSVATTPLKIKVKLNTMHPQTQNEVDADGADEMGVTTDETGDIAPDTDHTDMPKLPPSKRRRRLINRDKAAADLREHAIREKQEQEMRRRILRERLAQTDKISGDQSRLIINESKKDGEGFIYVNEHIGSRIKDHQVDGVRFMWNHIVADSMGTSGCLLAHTMGLGKTMQVVTLLVAIAESSSSPDPTVRSQIPKSLHDAKVVILCPAGLVDNWVDELLIWAPDGLLGQFTKVDSGSPASEREAIIRLWAQLPTGGVLVIGYTVLLSLVKDPELAHLLQNTPNIVVADEAHKLKNTKSQTHVATSNFSTKSRIALTGSPLANNVMDYYAMIDWAAPNFLGPIAEFKQYYETPIKEGLFADSSAAEKRTALKKLSVLKQLASPKMHRVGIVDIKGQLTSKKEFILYVPLTDIQFRAYSIVVSHLTDNGRFIEDVPSQAKIWTLVNYLSLLLAHPMVFKKRLEDGKKMASGQAQTPAKTSKKAQVDEDEDSIDELPEGVISETLSELNSRQIDEPSLSWKIMLLNAILVESKRLRDKVLVFSQSKRTLDFLERLFRQQKRKYTRLDGDTPVTKRQAAIKEFNQDESAEVYLISTKAGGVGLNIHGANRVVIFDFKYSPTDEQQAIGRAYRIGQTKPVYVYWLIVGGTFETTVQNRSVFKMQLSSRVVDKKNPMAWSKRIGDYFANPTISPQKDLSSYYGKDDVLTSLLESGNLKGGIRSIMMTETFEEEEPDDTILTKEDRQEVSELVHSRKAAQKQGKLRALSNTEPRTERAVAAGTASGSLRQGIMNALASYTPSARSKPNQFSGLIGSSYSAIGGPSLVPEAPIDLGPLTTEPHRADQSSGVLEPFPGPPPPGFFPPSPVEQETESQPSTLALEQPATVSASDQQSEGHTPSKPKAPPVRPMTGTATHFMSSTSLQAQPTTTEPTSSNVPPSSFPASVDGANDHSSPKHGPKYWLPFSQALEKTEARLSMERPNDKLLLPRHILRTIHGGLNGKGLNEPEKKARWDMICGAAKNERLCQALVEGRFNLDVFARMEMDEFQRVLAEITGMDEATFMDARWDPDNTRSPKAWKTQKMTSASPSPPCDVEATRHTLTGRVTRPWPSFAKRRKSRNPRLPTWGIEALNNHLPNGTTGKAKPPRQLRPGDSADMPIVFE